MLCGRRCIRTDVWVGVTGGFPRLNFANTYLPEERYKAYLNEDQLGKIPDDSRKTELIKMEYKDRPISSFENGRYASVNNICSTKLLAYYYVKSTVEVKWIAARKSEEW